MAPFLLLGCLGHVAQPFEAGRPVVVEKVAEVAHLVLARLVQTPRAVPSLGHEARRLEHAEVLRDRRATSPGARGSRPAAGSPCVVAPPAPSVPHPLPRY